MVRNAVTQRSMHHSRFGEGAKGARAGSVAEVMHNGMRCHGSRTWHVEDGSALIHGKHVGACANVDARILRLNVLNCQDAVEVHGPVRQIPFTLPGPNQGVGWELWEDEHKS